MLSFYTPAFAQTTATRPGQIRKEAAKELVQIRKENVAERLSNLGERIASKEATLKLRINKFKDKVKAQIVERIGINLNTINDNRVDQATKFLANAARILDKLAERVSSASASGKDTTSANTAITNARSSIASASSAVASQSAKEYTLSISSESAARAEIKVTRDMFHDDWKGIRELMIIAKQSVADAIRVAATTLGGRN